MPDRQAFRTWIVAILALIFSIGCGAAGAIETNSLPTYTPYPDFAPSPTLMPPEAMPESALPPQPQSQCRPPELQPGPGQQRIQVFFHCGGNLVPVARLMPAGSVDMQLSVALMQLVSGPSAAERDLGFSSVFSGGTAGCLQSVSVSLDGQAVASFRDFSAAMPNPITPEASRMMLDEMSETAFQFPEVQLVFLQFDGDCERFWNWQQASCTPIYRTH